MTKEAELYRMKFQSLNHVLSVICRSKSEDTQVLKYYIVKQDVQISIYWSIRKRTRN